MLNSIKKVLCVLVLVTFCSGVYALDFSDVAVSEVAGMGSNSAMCVIDFGGGNSYAFQYFWDGDATSQTMLDELNNSTALTVGIEGGFVGSCSYDGFYMENAGDWSTYLSMWWSGQDAYEDENASFEAKSPVGGSWDYGQVGVADRSLQDGYWDGWILASQFPATDTPGIPVPEPLSLGVLGSLAAVLVSKRK